MLADEDGVIYALPSSENGTKTQVDNYLAHEVSP